MALTQHPSGVSAFQSRRGLQALREKGIKVLCFLSAIISILTTAGIVYVLIIEAFRFFLKVSPAEFFTTVRWEPQASDPHYGVLPLVVSTLMITLGSGFISIPLGLFSAIYLSEYAPLKVKQILKPALELLAGVPTVVYGYFALFLVTPILQGLGWDVRPQNAAAGAIVVGIMTLPLVSSLCEDAISSVPRTLREAAYGLGATKMEVTLKIVVPAALSGIIASFILSLSRAIGETMAVTLAAGASSKLTFNPADSIYTMTAYIVNTSKGDVSRGTMEYQTIFAIGAFLFVITLAMNMLAQRIVKKFRRVYA